jgi:hypothetical protein
VNWQSREDERVARALEGAPPGRGDRGVVALAERIREVPAATGLDAAPDFRAALRARILAEGAALLPRPRTPVEATPDRPDLLSTAGAPSAGGPGPTDRPPKPRHAQSPPARPGSRRHRRRKAFAATALVIATLSATTVAATGDARPGDPLYGLKRKVQGVELIVARTDVDRGQRHLNLARIRVQELNTAGPSAAPGPLLSTLDDMDAETRAGIKLLSSAAVDHPDGARLTGLAAWTAEQRVLLTAAAARLPAEARARVAQSLALLTAVAARIEGLRGSLRCDDCRPASRPDDLGPKPCAAGCGTAPSSSQPPVQTQTRPPASRTAAPSATAPVPSWPAGRARTAPPEQVPSGGNPAPPAGPSWPNPGPPTISPSPSPEPVSTIDPTTDPTSEPSYPGSNSVSVPNVVAGVLGSVIGILNLTK